MLAERQTADSLVGAGSRSGSLVGGGSSRGRVNLLNWDGRGMPDGMFPDAPDAGASGANHRGGEPR